MNLFEEAVIYSTVMHTGAIRKNRKIPYILHPLEVAQIISTMTDDLEVIAAGVLHDVVEDTDGTLKEIRKRFGDRIADMVASETENKYEGEDPSESWQKRKEETLLTLKSSTDLGVKMLWLADKLSNIRSIASAYSEKGEEAWKAFHQKDPERQHWYYKSVAEALELDLNRTGAYKEFIKHINFIWPDTFETGKTRYKKYREYSVEGCKVIGRGAKSEVFRYDDELIIKVYNEFNTYKDIERENMIAKKALIAGLPTAISFGIVKVGNRYGSMFELINSKSVSEIIALDTSRTKYYADMMASLAKEIHSVSAEEIELPDYTPTLHSWVNEGIGFFDKNLADRLNKMIDEIPHTGTVIHGDFHTGNVMIQNGEPLIIDLDRLSSAHPIVELSGVYMAYVGFGELDKEEAESFMGFSYEKEAEFYHEFMKQYLNTDSEERINEVINKAKLLCYIRLVRRVYKKGLNLSEKATKDRDYLLKGINELLTSVKSFDF